MRDERFGRFSKVRAVLRPKILDTLKQSAKAFIGREGVFEGVWIIEDGHTYTGQMAMQIPRDWNEEQASVSVYDGFTWIPEEDLDILEIIDAGVDDDWNRITP